MIRFKNIMSQTLSIEVEGERLTDAEVLSMAMLLLLAGNETTTNLIVNFVRLMEGSPNEGDQLREHPEFVAGAVEETLRLRNSIRNIDRFALRDVQLGDTTIPAGGLVVIWLSAANRDPAAFAEPDKFLLERSGTKRHMGFGYGMHMCLGAPLARMETQTAAREIVTRTKAIELLGPPELGPNANFDVINRQIARFVAR
ncbi:cytochrome P450 [Mesorhizobium cantuariense]|uniref:Cytochrome P450 n=1 Tax=Mesorhizobium cantuariense TaxID=1300275 RepID=A0ABV7MRZ5_9HYPH